MIKYYKTFQIFVNSKSSNLATRKGTLYKLYFGNRILKPVSDVANPGFIQLVMEETNTLVDDGTHFIFYLYWL